MILKTSPHPSALRFRFLFGWLLVVASLTLGETAAVAADTIYSHGTDAELNQTVTEGQDWSDPGYIDGGGQVYSTADAIGRVGRRSDTEVASYIAVFKLPDIGAGNKFSKVKFQFDSNDTITTAFGGVDVYGLGRRDDSVVVNDDAFVGSDDPSDATLLMQDVIINQQAIAADEVFTVSGDAITEYLNKQYDKGAGAEEFIFIRLNPNATNQAETRLNCLHLRTSEFNDFGNDPRITYEIVTASEE